MTSHLSRVSAGLLLSLGVLGACRHSTDLLATPKPVGSQLDLRMAPLIGDTAAVALHFSTASSMSVGSVTAAVGIPAGWRFVECNAAQGEPLLACKATDAAVRIAGAWAAGTHTGDLLTLRMVRLVATATPQFTLDVQELHDGVGRSLADSVGVRREVTP